MPSKKLSITGHAGDELAARIDMPLGSRVHASALFAHCFTCSKDLQAVRRISRALTQEGIAVVRFDFTGLGESAGDFAETNFSSNIGDLVRVAEFMERNYEAPSILMGHSLGGAAVLQAAHRIPSAKAVASIGAPADPEHVRRHFADKEQDIRATGEAEIVLAGRHFTITEQFLDDLEQSRMEQAIRNLDRALLIFHSPVDKIVSIDNAERIYRTARHPKSFISLDTADHLLTDAGDAAYVGDVTAAWARKYVESKKLGDGSVSEEGAVLVHTGASGYRTDLVAGGHPLVADEPETAGGTDEGPSPYQLLAASLGSCTSMTLRMYADRKDWPLEGITVELTHGKVHAEDCEACPDVDRKVDRITRKIRVEGSLDDNQRGRLLEIADKCPVHRTLSSGVVVESALVADGTE